MHLIQIDFASPVYDEGFKLRQINFFESYKATIDLEAIAEEANYIHWGIYTNEAKLVGVAVQLPSQGRKKAILLQLVCQAMEEEQKKELLAITEDNFKELGYKKLLVSTPKEAMADYTAAGYEEQEEKEQYGITLQLMQKELQK